MKKGVSVDTLESEIVELRKLDELRNRVYQLRDEGFKALLISVDVREKQSRGEKITKPENRNVAASWVDHDLEPKDKIQPAIQFMVATSRFANEFKLRGDPDKKVFARLREQSLNALKTTTIEDLFSTKNANCPSPSYYAPNRSRVEIFQAGRVFQALVRTPETIFCRASLLAYYRIVRELHAIDPPNWMIGGARATEGGFPSAFMTNECTRGIALFSRAITNTSNLVNHLRKVYVTFRELYDFTSLPVAWKISEIKRETLALYSVVKDMARNATLPMKDEWFEDCMEVIGRDLNPQDVNAWTADHLAALNKLLNLIATELRTLSKQSLSECTSALKEIEDFNRVEIAKLQSDGDLDTVDRVQLAHSAAHRAASEFVKTCNLCRIAADDILKMTEDAALPKKEFDSSAEMLEQAFRVTDVFTPARTFLEGVLDREVEHSESGNESLGELVFALSAFVCIANPNRDARIDRGLNVISDRISNGRTISAPGHLDTDSHGYSLMLVLSEVHKSLALILDKTEADITVQLVSKIVEYFENNSVRYPEGKYLTGWCHDMPRHPRRAASWTTSLALLALDRIGRAIDKLLNSKIYRHFSVKKPSPGVKSLTLSRAIYPDYSDIDYGPKRQKANKKRSVSLQLERVRAHVLGVRMPISIGQECYSMILYGPPGTGKNTLVEALAHSCRYPLVEVTTSDFLIEGETFIERQARLVFEALSFLSKSVVLFDEFDPMIKARETEPKSGSRNVFSFLTPGLLPKLKKLNSRYRNNRSAMFLLTNKIGELDDAAIRSGRFDYKAGVFPPDLASRAGYLIRLLDSWENDQDENVEPGREITIPMIRRLCEVIKKSEGAGMNVLGQDGNLRANSKVFSRPETMMHYIVHGGDPFDAGVPDAVFNKKLPLNANGWLKLEHGQWKSIRRVDEVFGRLDTSKVDSIETVCRLIDDSIVLGNQAANKKKK